MRIGSCRIDTLLDRQQYPIGTDDENSTYYAPLSLPVFEDGYYLTLTAADGLVFSEVKSDHIAEESVINISNMGSSVKFTFQLQTKSSLVSLAERDGWLQYTPGASHMLSPAVHSGTLRVEPEVRIHQDTLFLPLEKVASLLDEEELPVPEHLKVMLVRPEAAPPLLCGALTPRLWTVLQELQACPFCGRLKQLYMEAKLTELALLRLYEELSPQHCQAPAVLKVKITRQDRCKLEEAAEILCSRIQHPPSLHELSVLVGLNVNKLKQGFHWLYGTTVFCFLHSLRMRQAYQLLQETELSINEISDRIGFSRQSAFSAAFKREFGFSPRNIKRGCR